ncbi:MAG: retroviral-like aspartic protease family protein [Bryobacteraceae bacterium]
MAYELRFSDRYRYDSRREGISIPAVLKYAGKKVELLANIDTGASYCLFEHGVGEALGLRIESGVPATFRTANSPVKAYGHELSIEVLGIETTATAYFFADSGIVRNVLGRRGWLDRFRLGLLDYEQLIYLADYNK